jgi:hypothetical protein
MCSDSRRPDRLGKRSSQRGEHVTELGEFGLPLGEAGFLLLDDFRRRAVHETGVAELALALLHLDADFLYLLGNADALGLDVDESIGR